MNNQQFRRLVLDQPASAGTETRSSGDGASSTRDGRATTSGMLGARLRGTVPMTPRTVGGGGGASGGHIDFVRQLKQQQQQGEPAAKRFKSAAAPKGSRLAAGYQDRAQSLRERGEQDELDDKERRVKALEEQYKLGQIERELFESLRDQIIGGDARHSHLVKGLDWKLLERVRRGEDVLAEKEEEEAVVEAVEEEKNEEDIERELEEMEGQKVQPLQRAEKVRQSEPQAGKKRTRDDILREMKAARAKAKENDPAQQALGARFKKVGAPQPNTSRVEKDEKGRDVLIMVDKDGNLKRKVRKAKTDDAAANGLLMPDKDLKPLGMEAPQAPVPKLEEDEGGDIFADAGSDYNPLGDMEEEASDSDSDSDAPQEDKGKRKTTEPVRETRRRPRSRSRSRSRSHSRSRSSSTRSRTRSPSSGSSRRSSRSPRPSSPSKPATTTTSSAPRNYFSTSTSSRAQAAEADEASRHAKPLQNATMLAALKRAAAIAAPDGSADGADKNQRSADAEKAERHRRMLASAQTDRDLEDMDLGFGGSRGADEEEAESGGRVKLSEWGADEGEEGEHNERSGQKPRKRGKKKKKGDKDSVADGLSGRGRRKGKD